jgi:hypothetical protein
MSTETAATAPRFMTRDQVREFLVANGYPIKASYFSKICLPSVNAGPPVAKQWGKRPLYEASAALHWAESRCRPVAQRVA